MSGGYMGAIVKGSAFVMDFGQETIEEFVRVADVRVADDVCCKVRLAGTTFWLPEFEFRRRATAIVSRTNSEPRPAGDLREALEDCDLGMGCEQHGVCYAEANGRPEQCGRQGLAEALRASLAKRSLPTMDPPYTVAFNAALDMVAKDVAPFLDTYSPAATAVEGKTLSGVIAEAKRTLRLVQGCMECNADDERRWSETIEWLERLA